MYRIRKVVDDYFPMNRYAVRQVKEWINDGFPDPKDHRIRALEALFEDSGQSLSRGMLLVADNNNGKLKGFAILMYVGNKCYYLLDQVVLRNEPTPGAIDLALYKGCRREAMLSKARGVFIECLPDDLELCDDEDKIENNGAWLRFYEQFGARPLSGFLFQSQRKGGSPQFLVCDPLGRFRLPSDELLKSAVQAILHWKNSDPPSKSDISKIMGSVPDGPIQLRPPRYAYKAEYHRDETTVRHPRPVPMVCNDHHSIRHVRARGYVEAPVRISAVLKAFEGTDLVKALSTRFFPEKYIRQVHNADLIDFLKKASAATPEGESVYPYVFPIRNPERKPRDLEKQTGYYCIDTYTPIHRNVWEAARAAVNCALSCACELLKGEPMAYALVRPPGHHAETRVYGGFCYLNTAAITANYLSQYGRVAILDIDYHHGNGQQEIFYSRSDVMTLSLHGHPAATFPYFSGYRKETGEGAGLGYNHNFPLKEGISPQDYRLVLSEALRQIKKFDPAFLVVAFGIDTAKGDPTGSFNFTSKDFERNGRMIASLRIPILVVQEGGYYNRTLGINARQFIRGIHETVWS